MLFSLVLAVASKEVELWQTFDDFAPRRLMEDGEEVEDHEEPEMDGDEDLEGQDEMGDDLIGGEEEEGLNPLMIAVPAAAALGIGAYFLMKGNEKEQGDKEGFNTDNITLKGLQDGETEAVAAAGLATALVAGTAMMMSGGTTIPATAGFLSTAGGKAAVAGTGLLATSAAGHAGGLWHIFPGSKYFPFITQPETEPETPTDDKPKDDKPKDDKPTDDKPKDDKPKDDKPADNKPKDDKPKDDKKEGNA